MAIPNSRSPPRHWLAICAARLTGYSNTLDASGSSTGNQMILAGPPPVTRPRSSALKSPRMHAFCARNPSRLARARPLRGRAFGYARAGADGGARPFDERMNTATDNGLDIAANQFAQQFGLLACQLGAPAAARRACMR